MRNPRRSIEEPLTHELARNQALKLLARRDFAERELVTCLQRTWGTDSGSKAVFDAVVEGLVAEGVVSDRRFAESFIRARVQRHSGALKIRAELRQRGVDSAAIDAALAAQAVDWVELAGEWLRRRGVRSPGFAERATWCRRLANRGFSHEEASAALAILASSP